MTANLEETKRDKKILIVSGERRGESAGRSKYNEMEIHRTNAEAKHTESFINGGAALIILKRMCGNC